MEIQFGIISETQRFMGGGATWLHFQTLQGLTGKSRQVCKVVGNVNPVETGNTNVTQL